MRILVVCPKVDSYAFKDTETKRIMRSIYKDWIEFILTDNTKVRCFSEDLLTCMWMRDFQIPDVGYLTTLNKNNQAYLDLYSDRFPEWKHYVETIGDAREVSIPLSDKIVIPSPLQYKVKDEYITAKLESIRTIIKYRITEYIKTSDAVLMFRAGGNQDTYPSLLKHMRDGDGRLLIEVDVKTGDAQCYYGGTYLDKDTVKTLIEM